MKIAVYSGSFDPLHIGHLSIMDYALSKGLFDGLYLIVSRRNPFKDSSYSDSAEQRYEAACSAVLRHPELAGVKVDDIELRLPPPSYTIRTLDALKGREPGNDFTLIIGGDNLAEILDWREGARILTDYGVAVYPRKGFDSAALRDKLMDINPAFRISLLDAPLVDVSATQIREGLAEGKDMSSLLM